VATDPLVTPAAGPLLSVSAVAYAYRGIEALRDVSLEVAAGEAVGVVGPNGAGKTTLAKVIAGILAPSRGGVALGGRPVSGLRPHEVPAQGIGIVLEGRHVFAGQTVRTNLEMGAFWRRLRRAALGDELERVFALFPDLERALSKRAGDLSGGQQQMLAVGRALMGAPRLLILDEPSMGLSPKLAARVYEAFTSLRDSGLAILLIEQNATLAFEFCERAYVLQYGRVALQGKVAELREADLVRRIYLGKEAVAAA
jgi:branched-chain amino acid transport system ATP-binding protein